MARPAESYRGARRNAWRATDQPWMPMRYTRRASNRVMPRYEPQTGVHRYVPYFCKPPRIKWRLWSPTGGDEHSLDAVNVPYTELRKQPRVY